MIKCASRGILLHLTVILHTPHEAIRFCGEFFQEKHFLIV